MLMLRGTQKVLSLSELRVLTHKFLVKQAHKLTATPEEAYVDQSCSGIWTGQYDQVWIARTECEVTIMIKKKFKQACLKTVFGYMKNDRRLERNVLKGITVMPLPYCAGL